MIRISLLVASLTLAVGACDTSSTGESTTITTEMTPPVPVEAIADDTVDPSTAPTLDITENAADLLAACVICNVSDYSGPLEPDEAQGLLLALNDEYHAEAVYRQVLDDLGEETRPFSNIIVAEQRHQTSLLDLFATYELTIPENPWLGTVDGFDTVAAACATGVDAEIINATLYDYLYSTTDRAGITAVYERLQAASNDKHLPAFERCSNDSAIAAGINPDPRPGADRLAAVLAERVD